MKLRSASAVMAALLTPAIVSFQIAGANTIPSPASIEVDGALFNIGAITSLIAAFSQTAAPVTLNPNYAAVSSASAATYNVATVPTGIANTSILRSGGAGLTDTTDLAYNIVNGIPGAFVGMTFPFLIVNTNTGQLTLAAGSGVTLAGTTTVPTSGGARWYQGKITQVTTASGYVVAGITGGTYSQSGNLVTLTLTGNTASAPTVGQAIQLTATSGALGTLNSAQWWPIVSVASATSFVVFNPVSQTTSGNVTTFTTGTVAPNVFSPLVTLTGMFATVTALWTA